jgi:hypothetical protein
VHTEISHPHRKHTSNEKTADDHNETQQEKNNNDDRRKDNNTAKGIGGGNCSGQEGKTAEKMEAQRQTRTT